MPVKVKVNWDLCIACGVCYALCPQVFEAGPDGKSRVVKEYAEAEANEGTIPDELKDCAEQSRTACPVGAITLE